MEASAAGVEAPGAWRRPALLAPPVLLLVAALALATMLVGGCGPRRSQSPFRSEVTYALPDDFRLAMLRFERRVEASDIEGTLRTFDPVAYRPDFRELERAYLEFARRTDQVEWTWRISDVRERATYRELEVPWTMTYVDVLHGHRVHRKGVTELHWSHHVVPRIVGMGRKPLFRLAD